jgi:hypothetical protein
MKGFNWAGDLNGHKNPIIRKYYVPDATAIEKGEPVRFTPGTGIVVLNDPTDLQDAILGVSMQEKAANDGTTEIEVSISPTAIYRWNARNKAYTLTGGSTTTAVDDSLLPDEADTFNNGKIRIVTCAADSSLIGREVGVTDYSVTTGILTLAETLPAALAAGDTINICPGNLMEGFLGWDLSSDAMNPDFDTEGSNVLKFLWSNIATMDLFFQFLASEPNT